MSRPTVLMTATTSKLFQGCEKNLSPAPHLVMSVLVILLCLTGTGKVLGQIVTMDDFADGASDGDEPFSGLTLSDSTLLGTTSLGGADHLGMVFTMADDGSGFYVIYIFNPDVEAPRAELIISGTMLFGASKGGEVLTAGTGDPVFDVLHGSNPNTDGVDFDLFGKLRQNGSTHFGKVSQSGANSDGTIFSLETSGSQFKALHKFNGTPDERAQLSNLILSDSTFIGSTFDEGVVEAGTIFSVETLRLQP